MNEKPKSKASGTVESLYDAHSERQQYHLRLRLSIVTVTFQDITYAYVMKSVS